MSGRFAGRSVLVTGAVRASVGAVAQLFAAEGGRVVVVDQNEADAEKSVALIKELGGDAFAVTCRRQPRARLPRHGRTRGCARTANLMLRSTTRVSAPAGLLSPTRRKSPLAASSTST